MFTANLDTIVKEHESFEKDITAFYDEKLAKTYPLMRILAKAYLSIPYSSVHLERLFSQIKLNKTPIRNRMEEVNIIISYLKNKYKQSIYSVVTD